MRRQAELSPEVGVDQAGSERPHLRWGFAGRWGMVWFDVASAVFLSGIRTKAVILIHT